MDKINWANYNYDDFEMFCNGLLTFELGKTYHPYSAAGKDGGIDGAFTGTYQNFSGNWRFQFKFSHAARGEAVSNLRYQLKKEVAKLAEENYFVLITNIELLPQEHKSLVEIFETERIKENKTCIGFIWDGAKIFNLLLHHPILFLWLNDGFTTAQIQSYKTVFYNNLNSDHFEPSSLANFFISRENELKEIKKFINSEDNMIVVTGEAGIGKTRLVIEFFKQEVDPLNHWIPLVLLNRNIDFDKLRKALTSKNNFIILIDDAHTYKPEIIADIKVLVQGLSNKVKLILTSRTIGALDSLSLLKEYEKILFIKLNELSRPDTEAIFKHYLENTDYKHYTNQLIMTSFGKPILIVAMLNAIFRGEPISKIKEQHFLKNYVNGYFKTYIEQVSDITGVNKLSLTRLLQNIVLIEPINFNDSFIINKLSELHCISVPALNESLSILVNNGFVNGRYEQSIKPDYYSDIILSQIRSSEIVNYVSEFSRYIDNIILNLSSVDEIEKGHTNVLNEILLTYIEVIENEHDIKKIQKVLSTISRISFVQPEVARKGVEIFLASLLIENHPIIIEYGESKSNNYNPGESAVITIIAILSTLYEFREYYEFVYSSTFKLYNILEESKIAGIYIFSKRDIVERFSMERQSYFVELFAKDADKYSEKELLLAFACCKSFMSLDFSNSEWDAVNRESIIFTTYYIPAITQVKKFRRTIINLLFRFYKLPNALYLKSQILNYIIDIPRAIFATHKNTTPYKNDVEIKSVLQFLIREGAEFNILDQKEILEKLYWFEKWGISNDLRPLIEEVKIALKPKNLTERLSQLFSKAEISILDMPNIEQYVSDKCDEMVKIADSEELADSIISFLEPQKYPPHYYFNFQKTLENKYPVYAKKLHDKMYNYSLRLYSIYGYKILSTLYFKHKENIFYWSQVKKLQKLNTVDADNFLLSIYSDKVPGSWDLGEEDIEIILKVFNKKKFENSFNLSTALQSLFAVKHPYVLEICGDFLDRTPQRQTEMFFIRLSDNPTVTEFQMSELVLKHTLGYQLTYEIEHCLNKILIFNGPECIFTYFLNRFNFIKNLMIIKKTFVDYEFAPDGNHSHLFTNCDPIIREEMFLRSVNWYLNLDESVEHLYIAKDLLEYLKPGKALSNYSADYYYLLINKYAADTEKLERTIMSLDIFHQKEENILNIIIYAFNIAASYKNKQVEKYESLRDACYIVIITMGVKSGSANMPFQVDVDLHSLLSNFISVEPRDLPSTTFLKEVLQSVEADINRITDKDNLTW
ncbi:hypothetical protein [Flavobacterium sp. ZS1P14]|uniref:hypothetical protein n=1 Tax=Flavobacterium sp. ZS1P14 TaxID=3401729 RepID=UPI003AAB44B2